MSDDAKTARVLGPIEETIVVRRELPHWASRALGLFLIALGAGAVLIAIFVPFPEVVEASFVLVPIRGADPIRSPIRGIVERVVATEGAEVRAGDSLFVIRHDEGATESFEIPSIKQIVTAPFDGVIVDLSVRRGDTLVERGEALCRMSPVDTPLRAEVKVPTGGVGLVAPGQSVRLLLDSYPYTRFGTQKGTLAWVAPVGAEGGFLAMCALHDTTVNVRGRAQPLRPGMTGQARIDVGRRTLLDYAMEPLRQLQENLAPEEK